MKDKLIVNLEKILCNLLIKRNHCQNPVGHFLLSCINNKYFCDDLKTIKNTYLIKNNKFFPHTENSKSNHFVANENYHSWYRERVNLNVMVANWVQPMLTSCCWRVNYQKCRYSTHFRHNLNPKNSQLRKCLL